MSLAWVPRTVCGFRADRVFDGELASQRDLADGVVAAVSRRSGAVFYRSGNLRFDGQSAVAIDQMTVMGLAQIVKLHPELRERYLAAARAAAAHLADPSTLAYAEHVYGHSGIEHMAEGEGHAYLGYVNLGLGMLRAIDPSTPLAALHDRLTAQLAQRLFASDTGLIETYPGETWPPDVAAVAGSIGLHSSVTGGDRAPALAEWAKRFARCAIDSSGYLIQQVESGGCRAVDAPRGSGTAVAAYFLSFAEPTLARRLHTALADRGRRALLGFGAIREYSDGYNGSGDVNAGPILFGVSVGATGFALGSAGAQRDRRLFVELYRTLTLFGAPNDHDGQRAFVVGGTLGNALLLAMLTARPS